MDFKVNSSDLLKALSHIHGIVEVRHTLPILSNIIITAKDNNLTLSSTNLDIFCSDKLNAEVISSGEISVSAVTFYEIIKRLPNGSEIQATFDDESSSLILKCGRSKFNLTTMQTEDFPTITDSDLTTKFILSYKNNLRELKIFSEATKLNLRNLKKSINKYDVVFFAPVFHEIDINEVNQLVNCNDKYFVSVPQGWIRIKNKKKQFHKFIFSTKATKAKTFHVTSKPLKKEKPNNE